MLQTIFLVFRSTLTKIGIILLHKLEIYKKQTKHIIIYNFEALI